MRRELDLYFELECDPKGTLGVLLHGECEGPYPSVVASVFIESYNCIVVRFKINGNKIECYDCSDSEMLGIRCITDDDDEE